LLRLFSRFELPATRFGESEGQDDTSSGSAGFETPVAFGGVLGGEDGGDAWGERSVFDGLSQRVELGLGVVLLAHPGGHESDAAALVALPPLHRHVYEHPTITHGWHDLVVQQGGVSHRVHAMGKMARIRT
jgi:hypothetical protein